jgi:hypothetical protein
MQVSPGYAAVHGFSEGTSEKWYRIVPMRSYVKGWKISPSPYLNQDLANIWLDE